MNKRIIVMFLSLTIPLCAAGMKDSSKKVISEEENLLMRLGKLTGFNYNIDKKTNELLREIVVPEKGTKKTSINEVKIELQRNEDGKYCFTDSSDLLLRKYLAAYIRLKEKTNNNKEKAISCIDDFLSFIHWGVKLCEEIKEEKKKYPNEQFDEFVLETPLEIAEIVNMLRKVKRLISAKMAKEEIRNKHVAAAVLDLSKTEDISMNELMKQRRDSVVVRAAKVMKNKDASIELVLDIAKEIEEILELCVATKSRVRQYSETTLETAVTGLGMRIKELVNDKKGMEELSKNMDNTLQYRLNLLKAEGNPISVEASVAEDSPISVEASVAEGNPISVEASVAEGNPISVEASVAAIASIIVVVIAGVILKEDLKPEKKKDLKR